MLKKVRKMYEILENLIRIDTTNPPGNEAKAAEYIGELLEREGFQIEFQEVGNGRKNVVATIGEGLKEERILTGHMDVVPAGGEWSKQPFAMTRENGRIYGRGSCDMKGAIAAMMAAAMEVSKERESLKTQKITLAFVCDEEVTGNGSRIFVKEHIPLPETYVVIGEPTGMQIHVAHRGVCRFQVEIEGVQTHAAMPEQGVNPILEMGRFLTAVEQFDAERKKKSYGILPPPTITPTIIHAEVKENVIPAKCKVILDCRTVPGETEEMLRGQITLLFLQCRRDRRAAFRIETLLNAPVGSSPVDGKCCQAAQKAMEKVKKGKMAVGYFNGSTDMPIFTENGYEDTIICGPGSLDMAHQIDEYVEEYELEQAELFYEMFLSQSLL
ncbi:MAG: M20 family metallopeptidase [Coprococcus sp.]|nr:M20 family metallopeptidase [Coprococcus sp.]